MDLDGKVLTAGDIMSRELVTAPLTLALTETLELMRARGVRRVPVIDGDGGLAGIVAIDDVVAVLADELGDLARVMSRGRSREIHHRQ